MSVNVTDADHGRTIDDVPLEERFRAARMLARVSQAQAARELGISRSTLARAEAGQRPIPAPWVLWAKAHWKPPEGMHHPLEND
jgi:DNA-binding XRE family transcriptional regulator